MSKIYNLKKQDEDNRDFIYKPHTDTVLTDNHFITDLAMTRCPILDQGSLGSCLANAIYALIYILSKGKYKLSRLQLYMCYRAVDGSSLCDDTGGTVRGGMSAIKKYGISSESYWPYIITKFDKLAPSKSFVDKYILKNFVYTFLPQDLTIIKKCLISGKPIVIGIAIYSSFETPDVDKYGVIPMPDTSTETLLGGHAILLIGYDNKTQVFKFQNSWSTSWGDKGYGYIPYDYVLSNILTYDLCTVSFN